MRTVEVFGTFPIPLTVEEIGKDGGLHVGLTTLSRKEVLELRDCLNRSLERSSQPLAEYCEQCRSYGCVFTTDAQGNLKTAHS